MAKQSREPRASVANSSSEDAGKGKRGLSQTDVPRVPLKEALRIPRALSDSYANAPTKPLRVAQALDMTTSSGTFRDLCSAAIAYGLTEGGAYAEQISLTSLGRRIVAPVDEGDDLAAMREASLKPRIVRAFLERYNNARLPSDKIARNVLEEMGVPREALDRALNLTLGIAQDMSFIQEIKGNSYIDLDTAIPIKVVPPREEEVNGGSEVGSQEDDASQDENTNNVSQLNMPPQVNNRVFITHGKNKDIVSQLKELLTFGSFEPVVSVETETVSKPVPDKVMDAMRSCYAAIIHVGTEMKVMDSAGEEHRMLNSNVLIEIGAAMALYRRRFILLVERGVILPSNLSGLYEVRYEGDRLDYEATMKLLRAFNDFKS